MEFWGGIKKFPRLMFKHIATKANGSTKVRPNKILLERWMIDNVVMMAKKICPMIILKRRVNDFHKNELMSLKKVELMKTEGTSFLQE